MRGWLLMTVLATAVGAGWWRERSSEVLAVTDSLVGASLAVAFPTPARMPAASGRPVVLSIDGRQPWAQVDERFLSVALDTSQVLGGRWWTPDAKHIEIGRGDTRTPPFDFARPRLLQLTAALAPAYLRIGGTEADVVYYDMDATQTAETPSDLERKLPNGYEVVLTRARWDALNHFAHDAGLDVLFTVNAGPGPRARDGHWTSENVDSLLEYTRAAGYGVPVWELGNEVDSFWFTLGLSHRVSGEQYAEDLALFRNHVRADFPHAKVAGPASFYWPIMGEAGSWVSDFMNDFFDTGASNADIITWHFYPQQSRRCPVATRRASPTALLDPRALDEAGYWADELRDQRLSHAPSSEQWLDETGNAQCGGEPGVSDRFVSSLWWVDELGLAARHRQRVVVRQTLSGSNYGLIDDETATPNPDYWASLLWKKTMGATVLDAGASKDDAFVRTYAHCTPEGDGSVSIALVNLHPNARAHVRIEGYPTATARLFLVTSPSLTSRDVYLNGQPMGFGDTPPTVQPRLDAIANGSVDLPAASYAFVELPDANAAACKRP